MRYRMLKTATAVLTAIVGVSASAAGAQAAVIDTFTYGSMNNDAEVAFSDVKVTYDWTHSTITPKVTGTLEVTGGDDACYRVHVISLADNVQVGDPTDYLAPHCPIRNDAPKSYPVDLTATSAPHIDEVKIELQKQPQDHWVTKDHIYVPVLTHNDDVRILGSGIDVGGQSFDDSAHEPTGSASVAWSIADDGQLKATYHGWLHLEPIFFGAKARVQIRALNNAGKVLATADGDSHSQITPNYEPYEDTLSVETADAIRLKVKMQTSTEKDANGNDIWQDVTGGDQTVSVAE